MYKINVFCDNGVRTGVTMFSDKFQKYYNLVYEPLKEYRLQTYSTLSYKYHRIRNIKTNLDDFINKTNECDTIYTSVFNNTPEVIQKKLLEYKNLFDKKIYNNFVFLVEEEEPRLKDFIFTMGYKYGYKYFKEEILDFQCYNSPNNQKVYVCMMSVNNKLNFKYYKRKKKPQRYNIELKSYNKGHATKSISELPKNRIIINHKTCPALPSLRNEGWGNVYIKHGKQFKQLQPYLHGCFNAIGSFKNTKYGYQTIKEMIPYTMAVSIFKNIRNHLL